MSEREIELETKVALLERDVEQIYAALKQIDEIEALIEMRRVQSEEQHESIDKDMTAAKLNFFQDVEELKKEFMETAHSYSESNHNYEKVKMMLYGGAIIILFILYKLNIIPAFIIPP